MIKLGSHSTTTTTTTTAAATTATTLPPPQPFRSSTSPSRMKSLTVLIVSCIAILVVSFERFFTTFRSVSESIETGMRTVTKESSPFYPHPLFTVPEDENDLSINCKIKLDALDRLYDNRREPRLQKVATARNHSQSVYDEGYLKPFRPHITYFDMWEPEATCIVEERAGGHPRFDSLSDGPKFVCGIDYIRELSASKQRRGEQPCLTYSIGSRNNVAFERAIKRDVDCEIHTFDPTMANEPFVGGAYATFHPWGLGIDGEENTFMGATWTSKSLDTIMKELDHTNRKIDILKIDCEGCEYRTMPAVFQSIVNGTLQIDQVLIEMHQPSVDFELPTRFFELADEAGFRITHKERNHWGCSGHKCVEYALVNKDFLRMSTASAIC